MADILPFCGIRYAAAGGDLAPVMAPPYDVISPDEQAALYERHPNNVIRLILGREPDRYASAASTFRDWLASGVLARDAAPSLYIYHQEFDDPSTGERAPDRVGIVCLLKLEEYATGKVLPHENTLTAAKTDRLELLRATHAQFESIYGLYSDPDGAVQSFIAEYDDAELVVEKVDNLIGSSHRIERIVNPDAVGILQDLIRDKPIFIADGHHRYETALNYRREVRAARGVAADNAIPEDYILITLTAFEDPGLLVLPTHRLVRNVDADRIDGLADRLASLCTLAPIDAARLEQTLIGVEADGRKAFGVVLPGGRAWVATYRDAHAAASGITQPMSDASRRLDVTLLQSLVLDRFLGIDPAALAAGGKVGYTRSLQEAVASVERGEYQAAFILARPTVEDVRTVSLAGDKMPQKSTFFYPKLLSGLVLRDLANDHALEAA
jgi:uncharacterized protein (DUF1015 family)